MSPATSPPPRRGSPTRILSSVALCGAALVAGIVGGLRLASVLEQGGYGTRDVTSAVLILGVSGGLLAIGVSLFVWDMSLRNEEPTSPTTNR